METIEQIDEWRARYADWKQQSGEIKGDDVGDAYPFVKNRHSPFLPARRALPMLNLALISSAGAFIDGSEQFSNSPDGDMTFREIPVQVEGGDLQFVARGYDQAAVREDLNSQIPLARLLEFQQNGIIGQLNSVFWSFSGFISNAGRLSDEMLPKLLERFARYEVQAALLIPASRLCHQSVSLAARAIEAAGVPTMTLAIDKEVIESVRPPRAALYDGQYGSVSGLPGWPEQQRRLLDEALRLIEPMDQAGIRRLNVDMQSAVQKERGER